MATIGRANSGYARSEVSYSSTYYLQLDKTYCYEWRGYFAQDLSTLITGTTVNDQATIIMQIHQTDPGITNSPPFELIYWKGWLYFQENYKNWNGEGATPAYGKVNEYYPIMPISDLYNKSHTIRWLYTGR